MTTPDLPPVGATVTDADGSAYMVESSARGRSYWCVEWAPGRFLRAEQESRPILTALWRAGQRIKELEELDSKRSQEIDILHAQHSSDVSIRDEKIKRLTQRLATFEALAREAKKLVSTPADVDFASAIQTAADAGRLLREVADLATPGEGA